MGLGCQRLKKKKKKYVKIHAFFQHSLHREEKKKSGQNRNKLEHDMKKKQNRLSNKQKLK